MQVNAQASFYVKELVCLHWSLGASFSAFPSKEGESEGEVGGSQGCFLDHCVRVGALSTFGHPCHWSEGSRALSRQYWMHLTSRSKGSPMNPAVTGNFRCSHLKIPILKLPIFFLYLELF